MTLRAWFEIKGAVRGGLKQTDPVPGAQIGNSLPVMVTGDLI